jgi:hypothetical protein
VMICAVCEASKLAIQLSSICGDGRVVRALALFLQLL